MRPLARCRHGCATTATNQGANGQACAPAREPSYQRACASADPTIAERSVALAAASRFSYGRGNRISLAIERNRIHLHVDSVASLYSACPSDIHHAQLDEGSTRNQDSAVFALHRVGQTTSESRTRLSRIDVNRIYSPDANRSAGRNGKSRLGLRPAAVAHQAAQQHSRTQQSIFHRSSLLLFQTDGAGGRLFFWVSFHGRLKLRDWRGLAGNAGDSTASWVKPQGFARRTVYQQRHSTGYLLKKKVRLN